MNFEEVPILRKFKEHVQSRPDCTVTRQAMEKVEALLGQVQSSEGPGSGGAMPVEMLALRCSVIEKATRVLWACASATNQIEPVMWEQSPDFEASLKYFQQLPHLEFMRVTEKHRIKWEQGIRLM